MSTNSPTGMAVTCLQENLARGLSVVGRAVATRSTLPILGNVSLTAANGSLRLQATNLDLSITHRVAARIDRPGAITIPARQLSDYVSALPPDQISLELNERTQALGVKCARYAANIKGVDAGEFPLIPEFASIVPAGGMQIAAVDPEVLKAALEQVVFCAATDDARPVLTGVCFDFDKKILRLAAADGFRLAVKTLTLTEPIGKKPARLIVPARFLGDLARLIGEQEEPIEIALTASGALIFKLVNTEVTCQLIEGNFPDVDQIIPKAHTTRTLVNTGDFLSAVKPASVFAREASGIVRLGVVLADEKRAGTMRVAATSAETGDGDGEIDAQVDGAAVEIAFNAKFLAEAIKAVGSQQVALETNGAASPGAFRPVGVNGYVTVIMPMALGK